MNSSRLLWAAAVCCGSCLMSCSSGSRGAADDSIVALQEADSVHPSTMKRSTIRTAHDPVALFPKSGGFSFARLSDLPEDPRVREAELETQLRTAIIEQMESKGFTFGTTRPRMLFTVELAYHGLESSATDLQTTINEYERVSCIITITQPQTANVMWRGLYEGAVIIEVDEQERNAQVRDGIGRMLKDFPPADGLRIP